jgi:hypothetical protein
MGRRPVTPGMTRRESAFIELFMSQTGFDERGSGRARRWWWGGWWA